MKLFVFSFFFFFFVCVVYGEEFLSKEKKLIRFTNWIDENNFKRNFDLAEIPNQGVGGVANKYLTKDDFLLKVPKSKLVFAKEQRNIDGWEDWLGDMDTEPLMIWVLREKLNPDSFWKPYLDILPEDFDEHPLFWSENEIEDAFLTNIKSFQTATLQRLTQHYEYLQNTLIKENPNLFPDGYFTFESYLWSYLAVNTRAWIIDTSFWSLEPQDNALVPLADMLNHQSGCGQGRMQGPKQFVIESTTSYSPGEQVFDSYGKKTSFDLLVYYGFLPENNINDGAFVPFTLPESEILTLASQLSTENINACTVHEGEYPKELLRLFRLNALHQTNQKNIENILKFNGISLENELIAYRTAILSLEGLLQKYPSEEEEQQRLLDPTLSENSKTAVKLRMKEKKIITSVQNSLREHWKKVLVSGKLPGGIVF